MAFHSTSSKDYVPEINNLNRATYTSKYGAQLDSKLGDILNNPDFKYDVQKDPMFQQYKQEYIDLGKEAVQNNVQAASQLTGGYGETYSAKAASQANQRYITEMSERIPQLMEAAMNKYQMERENNYKQFGALQGEENRLYGQHRDEVEDYYKDYGNLVSGYTSAQSQENLDREFEYRKQRDAIEDARADDELKYKYKRLEQESNQWMQDNDLKQKQYEAALAKANAKSSGRGRGGRRGSGGGYTSGDDFFKLKGTAASATYSGNYVDTSRNATLSLTKTNNFMKQLFAADDKQLLLNQWAQDGQISEGDYDYLVDMYNRAQEQGIDEWTGGRPTINEENIGNKIGNAYGKAAKNAYNSAKHAAQRKIKNYNLTKKYM